MYGIMEGIVVLLSFVLDKLYCSYIAALGNHVNVFA